MKYNLCNQNKALGRIGKRRRYVCNGEVKKLMVLE